MLEKLLNEIHHGGTLDIASLAIKLDTSPQMVEAMLEHLQRAGFLRNYEACSNTCDGCALNQDCNPQKKTKTPHLFYLP